MLDTAFSERYSRKKEELHQSIELHSINAAEADAYLQRNLPDDCAKKYLTGAVLNAFVLNGEITEGVLEMRYYRYLNRLRKGGNVAFTRFYIDVVKGELQMVSREHGDGRLIAGTDKPISQSTIDFPMELYAENLPTLLEGSANIRLRVVVENTHGGVTVEVFDDQPELTPYFYCERITEWTPGTPFAQRALTQVKNEWDNAQ